MINIFYQGHRIPADNSGNFAVLSYWDEETIAGITAAYQRGEYESVPDVPPPVDPDWTAFNIAMLQDNHWQSWALSPDLRTALIMAATTRDIQLFHNTWALAVSSSPPPSDAPAQWQSLADLHHVPLQLV